MSKKAGDRIREMRDALGLSQSELGKRSGNIAQQSMGDYESGKTPLIKEELFRIAETLGVSPVWLAFGIGPKTATEALSAPIERTHVRELIIALSRGLKRRKVKLADLTPEQQADFILVTYNQIVLMNGLDDIAASLERLLSAISEK